ncbi:MAG: MBL fold metallo-hydrolase, partial [Flavobacteriales bacterium]
FTHEHSDHTAGIDDLRPFCYKIGEMPIYLNQKTFDSLEQRFEYIFSKENRYPGAPSVKPYIVEETPFLLDSVPVVPISVKHGMLPILGYRIQNIAYLTDVKTISKGEKEKLRNLDVLILNALRIEEHPTHFNLQEALDFVEEIQPKKAYFTHISHKLGFHNEISKKLPHNVFLAFDGLKIQV